MNIIPKINILIENDPRENDIYTEYIIELFYDLMLKINDEKKKMGKNLDVSEFQVIFLIRNLQKKSRKQQKTSTCASS
jgi:hypothetical protein